jgi:hypothetical protein
MILKLLDLKREEVKERIARELVVVALILQKLTKINKEKDLTFILVRSPYVGAWFLLPILLSIACRCFDLMPSAQAGGQVRFGT